MKKRLLSTVLAICMVLSLLSMTAFAEGETIIASGECGAQGDNVTWTLDSEGTLTISGTGRMADYVNNAEPPWYKYWFEYREKLTSLVFEDGITYIGMASYGDSITSITIPASVTEIQAYYNFTACNKLVNFTVDEDNPNFCSENGILFSKDKTILLKYPQGRQETNYAVPEGVVNIGEFAFAYALALTSITLPTTLNAIGERAFEGCRITSIDLPDGLSVLGTWAFTQSSLKNVTIPAGVTKLGGSLSDTTSGSLGSAFYDCSQLESITVEDGNPNYTSVDGVLFDKKITRLIQYPIGRSDTSYTIPSGVTTIDMQAFAWSKNLAAIELPNSLRCIEENAFEHCRNLDNVTINGEVVVKHEAFQMNSSLTNVTLSAGVRLGSWVFHNCIALADVYYLGSQKNWIAITPEPPDNGLTSSAPNETYQGINKTATIHFAAADITYAANSGTGTMELDTTEKGTTFTLPACGFTAPTGKEFKAWQIDGQEYTPGDTYNVTEDTVVTALWKEAEDPPTPPAEYTLTGTITGHKGVTYTSVTAQLVGPDGSSYSAEVGDGVVDKTGKTEYAYTVSAPAGQYNLNVTATTSSGSIVNRTAVVNLTGDGQTQNVNLPNGQASSSGSGSGNSSNSNYKVSIPTNINGGTVTVSPTNARAGTTVTITASPNKGYELESIVVKDSKGNNIAVTEAGSGKYTFTMPSSSVSVSAAFVAAAPAPVTTFIDVEPGAYYADAVAWAVENGITSGTGNGKFSPNEPCTRSQIVTFLWRAAGCPEVGITTAFTDVAPGSYYEKAVAWAVANGITNGAGDGKFSPNEPCTRAQAVAFLYRANGRPSTDENGFSDVGSGLWYTDAVSWAVANGITNGTGNGRFSPDDICTRGQIVTFLYRDMA